MILLMNLIKPVYYKRYVGDIFVLFRSPNHLAKFNEYLNTKHTNVNLLMKKRLTGPYHF